MYESHFGFTGAPFSLNPDPAFFFGSRGHSNALSYLKFGVHQAEGFVVVTGEIGAGKTTLVRTLLAELDSDRIVAGQIVSTQLEAGDLLRSVALAFGVAPKNLSKAELIATIEAFLTLLATEDRRALLIVDEAQNLERAAVEELRMLSNFQLGNRALLQSFLVGQPELRALLISKPMEQFRQRVIASCHLGPMEKAETRAYVEHRLRQVGWAGHPSFDDPAFERIFYWTRGIPRRVNLLCNRLLLAAYLASERHIDAGRVDTIGEEVRGEVGEAVVQLAPHAIPGEIVPVGAEASRASAPARISAPPPSKLGVSMRPAGPLMFVVAGELDDVKAAVLLRAWKGHEALRQPIRVQIGDAARFAFNDAFSTQLGVDTPAIRLDVCEASPSVQIGEVMKRFAPILDEQRPSVVVVIGNDDTALACSLVAHKKGCRVVHLEAGLRAEAGSGGNATNSLLIDRLADVYYPSDTSAYLNLVREGAIDASVLDAGSLLVDAVQLAAVDARTSQSLVPRGGGSAVSLRHDRSYGIVALDESIAQGDPESMAGLVSELHEISREKRLVWPLHPAVALRIDAMTLRGLAAHDRITLVEPVGFVDSVALLKGAAFVLTDAPDVQVQAAVLQVRCLSVDPRRQSGSTRRSEPLKPPEGGAARRIADHLAGWIAGKAGAATR